MFSRLNSRNFLILALMSAALISLNACENNDDIASPVADETQIQAAGLWLPTAELMVATTEANEGQEAGIRQARGRWGSADNEADSHPMHGFLLEASSFLSDEQMVSLVNLLAETREQNRGQNGQCAQGQRGKRHGQQGDRQGRGQPGPREGIVEFTDELDLSEEQVAQLTALRDEHQAQVQAVMGERERGRGNPPTEEQRAQMEELRTAHQAQVKEILTEDQWAKLEELRTQKREEQREARSEQRQERGVERQEQRIEFLAELLDLTDEQRTAIEAVMAGQHDKIQAVSEEFRSGLDGERPTDEQREAHKAAMEELREESHDAIVELLDEDQAELFEALGKMRPEQRGRRGGRGHGRGGQGCGR